VDRTRGTEDLWQLTLQHSPIGMALVGHDGAMLVVNRALCEMLGYTPDELRAKRVADLTHPDDLMPGHTLFAQALAGEIDSFRLRKRYLRADGEVMWGDLSAVLVRQEDGRALHFVAQLVDVTQDNAAEERLTAANHALEAERRTLQAIFDTVDVGLLLIGRDGTFQRMNRRHAETMSLLYPDGHLGKAGQPGHIFGPDSRTSMPTEELPSYRAMLGEEFDDLRLWAGADPSHRAAFSVSARNVRDRDGEVTGAALAYKEITDLMRAMQVKEEFVATVSHELRTPLTSVLGHVELLVDRDDLPHGVQQQVRVIERNAVRLLALVTDLLHVAQATNGSMKLQRRQVDLVAMVEEAVECWRPQAEASGLTLSRDTPPSLVATVDRECVRRVVDNLLSNAVKYTEMGGAVTILVQGDAHESRISVSDTGIGIDEAEAEQMFTWFNRGAAALHRHVPGTGLGLNIVSTIVAAHGGEVTLESAPGAGSTFHVTLPHRA
jgi:two-component system phosphate regulon sensor histidine kinase PhoR